MNRCIVSLKSIMFIRQDTNVFFNPFPGDFCAVDNKISNFRTIMHIWFDQCATIISVFVRSNKLSINGIFQIFDESIFSQSESPNFEPQIADVNNKIHEKWAQFCTNFLSSLTTAQNLLNFCYDLWVKKTFLQRSFSTVYVINELKNYLKA